MSKRTGQVPPPPPPPQPRPVVMPWKPATFLERYGELIAAGIGLVVLGAAAGMVIFAAVIA